MNLSQFNYDLPKHLIAKRPPYVRGESKLLVINKTTGSLTDDSYKNIANYLEPNDLVVLNNSKVIKARLIVKKANGKMQELIIIEKHGLKDNWHNHKVIYRGKLKVGEKLFIGDNQIEVAQLLGGGLANILSQKDLLSVAQKLGKVPLPPYLNREADKDDEERYQTIWAKEKGSVAAPTASLNMTDETLNTLTEKGVKIAYLTLHVGMGTFLPIRTEKIEDHKMHQEFFLVPKETVELIQKTKNEGKSIVALGTTVARTLEFCGSSLYKEPAKDLYGEADIFIYPGYNFKIVDKLITNFHAPKSTVLMMAAAFTGWDLLRKAYLHSEQQNYKFLSYGDSMLIY